jgi:hypothetical protein
VVIGDEDAWRGKERGRGSEGLETMNWWNWSGNPSNIVFVRVFFSLLYPLPLASP